MRSIKHCFIIPLLTVLISSSIICQQKKQSEIVLQKVGNTAWWSGVINQGHLMPIQDEYFANFTNSNYGNQVQPMLISNQGYEKVNGKTAMVKR